MKLVLLGAGASYGASRYGEIRPPLVTGILPAAHELGMFSGGYATARHDAFTQQLREARAKAEMINEHASVRDQHLQILTAFIEEQFDAIPAGYIDAQIDFERLFALTEAELLGHHALIRHKRTVPSSPAGPDVLDLQMKLVLCGTLVAATRDVRCDYHDVLARWLTPGDAVVSFNYDLLIDRSLGATGTWFQDDGYGIDFTKHGTRQGDDAVWRTPRRTTSAISLLKPHGSLNWLYPRNSWDSVMNMSLQPDRPMKEAPSQLYCLDDLHANFEEDYPTYEWWERYDIEHEGYTFDLHSLIVPPSLSKPYRTFEPQMGKLWGVISEAILTKVEEIFLIGYSLREDDTRTRWILRKAARQAEKLKRIVLIDPSDDVAARAASLFAPMRVTRPCNLLSDFAAMIVRGAI